MPNFFYYDASGQKRGPINDAQLKMLATQGVINPQTPLETDAGHKGQAGQIPGLFTAPASVSPFAATTPQSVPIPNNQYIPTNHHRKSVATFIVYGLLAVATMFLFVGIFCHYRGAQTAASIDSFAGKLWVAPGEYVTGGDARFELRLSAGNWKFAGYCWIFFAVVFYGGAGSVFIFDKKRRQE